MNFEAIANPELEQRIRRRLDSLTKPPGSLGRLESLALQLGLIQRTEMPAIGRKAMPWRATMMRSGACLSTTTAASSNS